jgi:hypothetical protein
VLQKTWARVRRRLAPAWRWTRRTIRLRPLVCPADASWPLWKYVQWRIWYDRDPRLIAFEDKLTVKELARRCGVPTVPVLAELDAATLDPETAPELQPSRFVLKTNHGYNDVVFVERLQQGGCRLGGHYLRGEHTDWEEARGVLRAYFSDWLTRVHSQSEWAITQIAPRRVFAEPWLSLQDDYKVWVVRGRATFIFTFADRWDSRPIVGVFDREWRSVGPVNRTVHAYGEAAPERVKERFPRPAGLDRLIRHAEALVPRDMDFMRVDFYPTEDGDFLLGEATAYQNAGLPVCPDDVELQLGQMILRRWQETGPAE